MISGQPIRRVFTGIIIVNNYTDMPTFSVSDLYFVRETNCFYVSQTDQNGVVSWKNLLENQVVVKLSKVELDALTVCDENKFYFDTTNSILYYGINIDDQIVWIDLSNNERISDYSGEVNIKDSNSNNVLSTNQDQLSVILGNKNSVLNINASNLFYNNAGVNQPLGLVKLNQQGFIDNSLLSVNCNNAYFRTIDFYVNNLGEDNLKVFSQQELGITQPTIVQLLDNQDLIRDDVIPVYWDNVGSQQQPIWNLVLQFSAIATLLPSITETFKIKYLIAQQFNPFDQNNSNVSTLATYSFNPYQLESSIKSFTFEELSISQKTMIQLIDNYGVIRDDIIPIYWTQTGLTINLEPIWEDLTDEAQENKKNWQLKYLVQANRNVIIQSQTVIKQFVPYNEETAHVHRFSYDELNLSCEQRTVVQIITHQGVIMDTNVVVVWTQDGIQFDLSDLVQSGWITSETANWKLTYISFVGETNNKEVVSKKYFDEKIAELLAMIEQIRNTSTAVSNS